MIVSNTISTSRKQGYTYVISIISGTSNSSEANQITPYGFDSTPIANQNIRAAYSETTVRGVPVVLGYMLPNQMTASGESRMYATNSGGAVTAYIWLHNTAGDGRIEIGGTADNAVGFNQLQTQFNELNSKFNALVTLFNVHIHSGVTTGPGVSGPTTPSATTSTANISLAKKAEIKTL